MDLTKRDKARLRQALELALDRQMRILETVKMASYDKARFNSEIKDYRRLLKKLKEK